MLLSAGQLIRLVLLAVGQTQQTEHVRRAPRIFRNLRRIKQRQLDVLDRRGARQKIETLEYEADTAAANARQRWFVELRDVDAFQ